VISKFYYTFFLSLLFACGVDSFCAQNNPNPAPYCNGGYTSGNCLQGGPTNTPGNSVNDFIDNFITSGGNTNISNTNSGCNGNPNNYANYCNHYLAVSPGQVITCSIQSTLRDSPFLSTGIRIMFFSYPANALLPPAMFLEQPPGP
jgi:hypothetical protein